MTEHRKLLTAKSCFLFFFVSMFSSAVAADETFDVIAPIDGYVERVAKGPVKGDSTNDPATLWRLVARAAYSSERTSQNIECIRQMYDPSKELPEHPLDKKLKDYEFRDPLKGPCGFSPDAPPAAGGAFGMDDFVAVPEPIGGDPSNHPGYDLFVDAGEATVAAAMNNFKERATTGDGTFRDAHLCRLAGLSSDPVVWQSSPALILQFGELLSKWQIARELALEAEEKIKVVNKEMEKGLELTDKMLELDQGVLNKTEHHAFGALRRPRGTELDTFNSIFSEPIRKEKRHAVLRAEQQRIADLELTILELRAGRDAARNALLGSIIAICTGGTYCPTGRTCEVVSKSVYEGQFVPKGSPLIRMRIISDERAGAGPATQPSDPAAGKPKKKQSKKTTSSKADTSNTDAENDTSSSSSSSTSGSSIVGGVPSTKEWVPDHGSSRELPGEWERNTTTGEHRRVVERTVPAISSNLKNDVIKNPSDKASLSKDLIDETEFSTMNEDLSLTDYDIQVLSGIRGFLDDGQQTRDMADLGKDHLYRIPSWRRVKKFAADVATKALLRETVSIREYDGSNASNTGLDFAIFELQQHLRSMQGLSKNARGPKETRRERREYFEMLYERFRYLRFGENPTPPWEKTQSWTR